MGNQTKLSFTLIKDEGAKNIKLDLPCTIPLNVGDRYVRVEDDIVTHLEVSFRVYVEETNSLIIAFKEF
jgi:hypothetical protein